MNLSAGTSRTVTPGMLTGRVGDRGGEEGVRRRWFELVVLLRLTSSFKIEFRNRTFPCGSCALRLLALGEKFRRTPRPTFKRKSSIPPGTGQLRDFLITYESCNELTLTPQSLVHSTAYSGRAFMVFVGFD